MIDSSCFTLEIISPHTTVLCQVAWVEVRGVAGDFTVARGHEPLVAVVRDNSIVIYKNDAGETVEVEVSTGLFGVGEEKAVLILDR